MKQWILMILMILLTTSIYASPTPTPTPITSIIMSVKVNTLSTSAGYKPDINYDLQQYINGASVLYNAKFTKCIVIFDAPSTNRAILEKAMHDAKIYDIPSSQVDILDKEFHGYKQTITSYRNTTPTPWTP